MIVPTNTRTFSNVLQSLNRLNTIEMRVIIALVLIGCVGELVRGEEDYIAVDSQQWPALEERARIGLKILRDKLTVQYLPLNLAEVHAIRQRIIPDQKTVYSLDVILEPPSSECNLLLHVPVSAPDSLDINCGQNKLSIVYPKKVDV